MLRRSSSPRRFAVIVSVGIALAILISACSTDPQSTFDPAGPVADRQLSLFWLMFWLAVAVFVLVEGILFYSIIRFRRRKNQEGLPPQTHGNTPLEIAWTIAPALVLVVIAVPTYLTIADQRDPPEGDSIHVEVVAHQWWWEFRYPDLGVTTANELHIPVNKVVTIDLISGDVQHSFWVPKLAGKTDVLPNNLNQMWFLAEETGVFFGQCAELCGVAHAQMRFRVVSETEVEFDAWVRGQREPSPDPEQATLAAEGRLVFAVRQCVLCHTVNGTDTPGVQEGRIAAFEGGSGVFPGPNLTHFGSRGVFAGGIIDNTTENLRRWLEDPEDVKPGNRMAQLAVAYADDADPLTDQEINALVAFLQSRKPATN